MTIGRISSSWLGINATGVCAFVTCVLLSGDCLAGSAGVDSTAALPDVDSCISRLDPELDIGYERVAARCPDLIKQLEHGAWTPWLPRGWKESGNDLSAGSLNEFRSLVEREESIGKGVRTLDVGSLQPILDGLAKKDATGWWSRFKSWLRSILEIHEQAPDESWFSRLVAHVGLSQSLRQLAAYLALGAVVVLALGIVFNELRAAGLFSRGRAADRKRSQAGRLSAEDAWGDIEQVPLLDKPRLMLERVVRRLGECGYLPPGALTVSELTRVVQLADSDDRARLSELATTAERVRYSAQEIAPAVLEGSVVRGRELLRRLDANTPA